MRALTLGQRDIVRFKNQAEGMVRKAQAQMAKRDEIMARGITAVEISASAFVFSVINGKFAAPGGSVGLKGVPLSLIAGIGAHLLGFSNALGAKNASHVHAFADGALASFMGDIGRSVGARMQTAADRERIARSGVSGDGDATGGASLADEELARMVRAGA